MEVRASAKYVGVSPRKVRLVLDHVRGRPLRDALNTLRFMPVPSARIVEKVVKSAAANAENNYQLPPDELRIKAAYAGDARQLKRFRPRARGRVAPRIKRLSHVTVIVEDQEV